MGKRLTGFDYSRPYFYMVTLKCRPGRQALSEIVAPGTCRMNPVTRAMVNCIRNFHLGCKAIAPVECFTIMPDHVHLLLRIVENPERLRLETIVSQMMAALEGRYSEVTGLREEVFDARWHDWIVAKKGQLAAFTRYIRENPKRRWLRMSHPEYFCRVADLSFAGQTWKAYGNAALIVLHPEGFGPRWHPVRNKEALCAQGRMLFLSLYEPSAAKPDNATLYRRCHEMGDLVVAALGGKEAYEHDA